MELLDEIYKTVKCIDGKVGQLLQWRAAHTTGHKLIKRDLNEIRKCLFRRGGLMTIVQGLQGCKNDIKSKAQIRRQFILGILSKVIAAGIIAFMTWLIISYSGGA